MATFADIQLAIARQTSVEQGVAALLQQLSAQLHGAIEAEDPAQVQAVLDMINSNTKALSDAVLANTPSAIGTATLATPVPSPAAPANPPPVTETAPAANVFGEPAPDGELEGPHVPAASPNHVPPPSAPPRGE